MKAVGYIRVSVVGDRGGDSFISPQLQREAIEGRHDRPCPRWRRARASAAAPGDSRWPGYWAYNLEGSYAPKADLESLAALGPTMVVRQPRWMRDGVVSPLQHGGCPLAVRLRARLLGRRHERHRARGRGERRQRRLAGVGGRGVAVPIPRSVLAIVRSTSSASWTVPDPRNRAARSSGSVRECCMTQSQNLVDL